MKRESKEATVISLRANLRDILNTYYPYNNFEIKLYTEKNTNTLNILIYGCGFGTKEKELIKKFVEYKVKGICRKKTRKEGNKIIRERIFYSGANLVFFENCNKYSYFKNL